MLQISSGQSSAKIDATGAYLHSLILGGREILKSTGDGEQTHGGCAVLIPYAGRVRNATYSFEGTQYLLPRNYGENSIHGFVKNYEFSTVEKDDSSVALSLSRNEKGYPVPLETLIGYSLDSSSLKVSVSVSNKGNKGAPLLIGFHPYFIADKGWQLAHTERLQELNFSDGYFPDGTYSDTDFNNDTRISERQFDNAYLGGGEITLENRDIDLTIQRKNMDYLVIYNGEYAEGKSVAVEPMSGAPDAFNNHMGLVSLGSGETYDCGFSIVVKQK